VYESGLASKTSDAEKPHNRTEDSVALGAPETLLLSTYPSKAAEIDREEKVNRPADPLPLRFARVALLSSLHRYRAF
jgi:hypothetical protein